MKLSPNWIRDYVDLTVDDRRLAEDLTNVGIGVEGIAAPAWTSPSKWRSGQTAPMR